MTQNDLKRVMAYSTVSQLGYMFMALGAGVGDVAQLAVVAAMFHLFTHAFFKALLFLASGSVMHAMGDVIDMRRFGGLRHRLPITCWTFAVGGLALAAIPPLSGFFSKDEILLALSGASHAAHEQGWGWVVRPDLLGGDLHGVPDGVLHRPGVLHDVLGPEKLPSPDDPEAPPAGRPTPHGHRATGTHGADDHAHGHHEIGHESPPLMTYPADGAGRLHGPDRPDLPGRLAVHRRPGRVVRATTCRRRSRFESLGHGEHGSRWMTAIVGTLVGVAGIGLSYVMYAEPSPMPGAADGAVPAAVRGLAAQVLRRRDLSVGRRRADPRAWPSSATSWTRTWWIGW